VKIKPDTVKKTGPAMPTRTPRYTKKYSIHNGHSYDRWIKSLCIPNEWPKHSVIALKKRKTKKLEKEK